MKTIQEKLDYYYANNMLTEARDQMLESEAEYLSAGDYPGLLFIYNELLSYYRVTSDFSLGQEICQKINATLKILDLEESLNGATSYLNLATFYRVAGYYAESKQYYQKCLKIYREFLPETDQRFIALYNNISLLYQMLADYDQALANGYKAISLIGDNPQMQFEKAVTYANLAQFLLTLNKDTEAFTCINEAKKIFTENDYNDPHYLALLASEANYYYNKGYLYRAYDLNQEIMTKLVAVYGKNQDYQTIRANNELIEKEINQQKGINLAQGYFLDVGLPVIEKEFPDHIAKMAFGLVGMGSECLGYDDLISQDHDYGPGFCIFLPRETYLEIGPKLEQLYQKLPGEYRGFQRIISKDGAGRVGVFIIEDFFSVPRDNLSWLERDEYLLLILTSGKIFADNLGTVTRLREELAYYPQDVWLKKIAGKLALMAQTGQYNYERCWRRKDYGAAALTKNKFIEATLEMVYLLNKKYKPYYKWAFRGLDDLTKLQPVGNYLLDLIFLDIKDSANPGLMEKICCLIIQELNDQGLIKKQDSFLDSYIDEVLALIKDKGLKLRGVLED